MKTQIKSPSVIVALLLMGAFLVSPGAADHDLASVTIDEMYSETFNVDDGGWTASDIPDPVPKDPQNPSWGRDEIPDGGSIERPPPVNPDWEWGAPTSGPGDAYNGSNVWATNLGGFYTVPQCAAIASPPIDLTGASSASVALQHWVHMDTGTTLAFHAGIIMVTTDGGDTFTIVEPDGGYTSANIGTSARACLDDAPSGTNGFSGGPSSDWSPVNVDLSAFAGDEVQVVFAFGTDGLGTTFNGWYVDEFAVTVDGVTDVEDFEQDDGGFTVIGTGVPEGVSFPPGGAYSGTHAWGTEPLGNLPGTECSALVSPPIDLTGATTASVAFQHWTQMRETTFAWHGALVFLSSPSGFQVIEPAEGYDSETLSSASRTCLNGQPTGAVGISGQTTGWEELNFDLSDHVGSEVQIVIGFRGDGTGDHSGFYLDDFATTIDGDTTVEDFESSDGGFTVSGVGFEPGPLGWSWDHPTHGPAMNETQSAWATNPHGNFGRDECSFVESGPIEVTALGLVDLDTPITRATLSWDQFYRGSSISTGGVIQIGTGDGNYTILEPTGGYPGDPSNSAIDACLGHREHGTGAMSGLMNTDGDQMQGWAADVSAYLGEEITLRFVFASTTALNSGWYVSDVALTYEVFVPALHTDDPNDAVPDQAGVPFTPIATAYAEDFAENDGGFTTGGTAGTWEWGTPQEPPEIREGQTPNVWGTNLDGDHGSSDCGWIQSPPIDLSGYPAGTDLGMLAKLSFEHWIDARFSSSSGNAWSGGIVMATATGDNWTVMDPIEGYDSTGVVSGQANCLGIPTDQGIYSTLSTETTAADAWRTAEFDVTEYLGGDLHLRWFFGSGGTSITERGWYVDDVSVQIGAGALVDVPSVDPNDYLPDEVNIPFTPLATAYSEDFAENDGGYTVAGASATWEWGTPQDPPEIREGQTPNIWGTNLNGDHDSNECAWIESTPIDLSAYPVPSVDGTMLARLSFDHWIDARMSATSGNAWSGGLVMVSPNGANWTVMDPIEGYDSTGVFTGQANCLGVSSSQGIYSSLSTETTEPDAWRTAEFDVTEFLGGDLHVRWFFGAGGTSITERGWYIDDVAVQVGLGANIELGDLPLPGLGGNNAPGWTSGGSGSSWEYGTVTMESSHADDIRGQTGYATNLGGNSNDPECSYIQSPAIPGALLAANPTLVFEHWYRIPGASVDVAWGGGLLMASDDGGVSWDYLDLPEYDRPLDYSGGEPQCFVDFGAPIDGRVFSGVGTDLETVTVDLSDYVGSSNVMVRFVFGNVVFDYEGWFINQVEMGGVQLLS